MTRSNKGRPIAPAEGKLGVLLPGMGAVATTFIAGVEAIRKGLSAGETVVTDGIDKLEPGTKVAVTGAGNRPQAATAPPGRSTK